MHNACQGEVVQVGRAFLPGEEHLDAFADLGHDFPVGMIFPVVNQFSLKHVDEGFQAIPIDLCSSFCVDSLRFRQVP